MLNRQKEAALRDCDHGEFHFLCVLSQYVMPGSDLTFRLLAVLYLFLCVMEDLLSITVQRHHSSYSNTHLTSFHHGVNQLSDEHAMGHRSVSVLCKATLVTAPFTSSLQKEESSIQLHGLQLWEGEESQVIRFFPAEPHCSSEALEINTELCFSIPAHLYQLICSNKPSCLFRYNALSLVYLLYLLLLPWFTWPNKHTARAEQISGAVMSCEWREASGKAKLRELSVPEPFHRRGN
ncbi:piezo-type mechanosensitive ion channel component 1 isoform X1 [Tachysurus ichikawai]